jgi:hypothetical protein
MGLILRFYEELGELSMNNKDKKLGMNKDISRRDFINGVGIALG